MVRKCTRKRHCALLRAHVSRIAVSRPLKQDPARPSQETATFWLRPRQPRSAPQWHKMMMMQRQMLLRTKNYKQEPSRSQGPKRTTWQRERQKIRELRWTRGEEVVQPCRPHWQPELGFSACEMLKFFARAHLDGVRCRFEIEVPADGIAAMTLKEKISPHHLTNL